MAYKVPAGFLVVEWEDERSSWWSLLDGDGTVVFSSPGVPTTELAAAAAAGNAEAVPLGAAVTALFVAMAGGSRG